MTKQEEIKTGVERIINHANIEIKGEGTLGNYRGYEITNSRFFAERLSPLQASPLQEFDATGILFRGCIFQNCRPRFREQYEGDFGCDGCWFIEGMDVRL